MNKFKKLIPWGISLMPLLAAAAEISDVITKLTSIVNAVVPVLMLAAFVVFLWGVIKFITAGGDEEKRKSAKNLLIYGLIGLFVMVAVWGIIKLVGTTFGITPGEEIQSLPGVPRPGS